MTGETPGIVVLRAAERYRGGEPGSGISTGHHLSFAGHYDPDNVHVGPLVAANEEELAGGAGFAEHAHRDVEIVTWVRAGELAHRDAGGGAARVTPGVVQRLSAGSGIRHTEANASAEEPVSFVQWWIQPDRFGGEPAYARAEVSPEPGALSPMVAGAEMPAAPLGLRRADAAVHLAAPLPGVPVALPDAPRLFLLVLTGACRIEPAGVSLVAGDDARLTEVAGAHLLATGAAPATALLGEFHGGLLLG